MVFDASVPGPFPEEADSPELRRRRLLREVHFTRGWSRITPATAVPIFVTLTVEGPLTRAELHEQLRRWTDGQGLDAPVWEPLSEVTDAELDRDAALDPDPPPGSVRRSAAKINAEERAHRAEAVPRLDRYAAAVGNDPVRSLGDLLHFMTACGELVVDGAGRYAFNPSAPLAAEVLPLPAEEVELQDQRRWDAFTGGPNSGPAASP